MATNDDLTGRRFGMLTVLERLPEREDRYACYRCRCDCGSELRVNARRLLRGTVRGCPECCEPRGRETLDLTGQTYGSLTVLSLSNERISGRRAWLCSCRCGQTCLVSTHDLRSGHTRSCGCSRSAGNTRRLDLTGQTFGWLKALAPTDERDSRGSVLWRCRCRCGNACLCSEDALMRGKTVSCGCYRRTVLPLKMGNALHHADGTCVEFLLRGKRSDNTTGHTGVYALKNGKYRSDIGFKKKRYYLGTFDSLANATEARRRAQTMHGEFLDAWYRGHPEQMRAKRVSQTLCARSCPPTEDARRIGVDLG